MRYAVTYNETTFINSQAAINMEQCSCATFENKGDDTVTINKGIKLAAGQSIVFENLPNEFINQSFKLVFEGTGIDPNVLLIKKFVTPSNK